MTCPVCSFGTTPCGSWSTSFFQQLCHALGDAGVNAIPALEKWCSYEGTTAPYNPLASTWATGAICCHNCLCGEVPPCSSGCYFVRGYPDVATGVAATAANLKAYSAYAPIRTAIAQDKHLSEWACIPGLIAGIRTWGTNGFANYLEFLGCNPVSDPCAGVKCPSCQHCVNGTCVAVTCPAGETCVNGVCTATGHPPSPQPPGADALAVLLIGGGIGALALWAHSHPDRVPWHRSAAPRRGVPSRASFRRGRSPAG